MYSKMDSEVSTWKNYITVCGNLENGKISQNTLANDLGITRASVNAWEMGISAPNAQSLVLLSKYFNVSVDYLLGLDNNEYLDISQLNATEKELVCAMVRYLTSIKKY